jgi:hypothetical protein
MFPSVIPSRRALLKGAACGFGHLAFAGLAAAEQARASAASNPFAPRTPHHTPRARRVIFLFMQGGPSHVDTFDPKPTLDRHDGKLLDFDDARTVARTGKGAPQLVMKSPWRFARHGQSGRWVSELLPHTTKHVDKLCVLRGVHTEGVAHDPATLFLHTGSLNLVRPSMGAWVTYGLGTENEDLPAFVTLTPPMAMGGPRNWGSAFLPAAYQGTAIGRAGVPSAGLGIRNLRNLSLAPEEQGRQLALLRSLNEEQRRGLPLQDELDAVVGSFELAWRMQTRSTDVLDLTKEAPETLALYGIGEGPTDDFGRRCLMARRLAESGVRFVQVTYGDNSSTPGWDQHTNLSRHADHARATDKPVAGLLADLERRGLLDDTLIWWGGEFGRTPYAEKKGTGRDHNPDGFTVWLAGGGVKRGFTHGATDDFGHRAIEGRVHMHDLHATILHLLGLDHEKLTFRHEGRDFRLTDVHGRVVEEILA